MEGEPPRSQGRSETQAAQGLAFADRSESLGMYVAQDVPAVQVVAPHDAVPAAVKAVIDPPATRASRCGCATEDGHAGALGLVALAWLMRRRRR